VPYGVFLAELCGRIRSSMKTAVSFRFLPATAGLVLIVVAFLNM
jgi:hypothetical protein